MNNFRKLGIGKMTSNSKNESIIGSKKLGCADETLYPDATGEEVALFE